MDNERRDSFAESGLFPVSGPDMLTMPAATPCNAGPALRDARERRGMTIGDVAQETRIAIRHLTAIEDGRFEGFAAPVYVIGFARNYAGAVGVPREWIGDCLRDEVAAHFADRRRFDLDAAAEAVSRLRLR